MRKTFILCLLLVFGLALLLVGCGEEEAASTTAAPTTAAPTTATTGSPGAETTATTAPPATETTVAPMEKVKFTYNNFFPPTHNNSILAEMWMAEITKRTNGAVTFEYFPGASLTAPPKVYDGVVTGISDIGFSVGAYTPGLFPLTELIDLPQGYTSGYQATMVANEFYEKFMPAEWDQVHVFYFYATGPQVVFTTKKEVNTLEDMNGLVIRSTGVGAAIAGSLGAEGYAAAQNEAYELMSKGVIDGSIAPREVLLGWKQAEVVNYVVNAFDIGSVTNMYVVMNKAKWDSLSPEAQQVFTDVSKEWVENHAKVSSAYDADAMVFFNEQPNRKVIDLAPEEGARWKEAVKPMVDKAVADLNAKGLPGDEALAFIQERMAYWAQNAMPDAEASAWVKENVMLPE